MASNQGGGAKRQRCCSRASGEAALCQSGSMSGMNAELRTQGDSAMALSLLPSFSFSFSFSLFFSFSPSKLNSTIQPQGQSVLILLPCWRTILLPHLKGDQLEITEIKPSFPTPCILLACTLLTAPLTMNSEQFFLIPQEATAGSARPKKGGYKAGEVRFPGCTFSDPRTVSLLAE